MIPVGPKPEPKDFDHKVRQKGWEWLKKQKLDKNLIAPKGTQFEPYWRECFGELWESYEGICAYTSMFFRRSTGAGTTEHFAPKSLSLAGQAYEWSNYRLACRTVNSKKSTFEDVLDPFELKPETFFLNFGNLELCVNPSLKEEEKKKALQTIDQLGLNAPHYCDDRSKIWNDYIVRRNDSIFQALAPEFLRRESPFLWYEARRQGFLGGGCELESWLLASLWYEARRR